MTQGKRKTRLGRVTSDKMDKTVVVMVETRRRHPRYHRVIRHRVKFKAHDAENACRTGDLVRIVETRPLSREKRWRVEEILARGVGVEVPPKEMSDDSAVHQA